MKKITYSELYINGGGVTPSFDKIFDFLYEKGCVSEKEYQKHAAIRKKYKDIFEQRVMEEDLAEYNRIKQKYDL